ncbi:MAG TPA: hypothetical protein VFH80_25245, partial [Solirubrobacteraceae bacterium]|nr:hypothetical protein [Solirubrobacteraceae bacterium]
MVVVKRAIRGLVAVVAAFAAAAPAAHATLGVPTGGNPIMPTTLASFEAAAGGADNGTAAGEQRGGFRHATWDDVKVDGTDPGSTVIKPGHVVAPSRGRLQPWGLELGPDIAVADDGFHSVNSNAQNVHFSPLNVWAPFNSNTAEFDVIVPSGQGGTPVPAQTRGLGVEFLNVNVANQTTIQYYDGQIPLFSQPVAVPTGTTSFLGVLFPDPVVTRVVITLGDAEIFDVTAGTPSPGPAADAVTGDDVVLAEPAPAHAAVSATAGVPVSAVLDTFTESNSGAKLRATIDWGDGARTAGTISPTGSGTFVVTGDHAYAQAGGYDAAVTVEDFEGPDQTSQTSVQVGTRATATSLTCSPSSVAVTATTTCTATVSDTGGAGASTPTGLLSFSSTTTGAGFGQDGGCLPAPTAISGVASCAVQFTPSQRLSNQAHLAVVYAGDGAHAP